VSTVKVCLRDPSAPDYNCTNSTCFENEGTCSNFPKVCSTDNVTSSCNTAECLLESGDCGITEQICAPFPVVEAVAGAIGAAAIVGIAIAVVACIGFSSAGTYAVVNNMNDGSLGEVQNNPLFKASGNSQVNPLFKEGV
jgi:hypothetical protein